MNNIIIVDEIKENIRNTSIDEIDYKIWDKIQLILFIAHKIDMLRIKLRVKNTLYSTFKKRRR
jgi:hypothetical protein